MLDTGEAIIASGLKFIPFAEDEFSRGSVPGTIQRVGDLSGAATFASYLERMSLLFRTSFAYLPEKLLSAGIELLIIDQAHYAGATIAEQLNIPLISLANALLTFCRICGSPP